MIWSLAREQLRSQRRYIAWAAVVVVLAVAIASYGALIAAELDKAEQETNRALVWDTEHTAFVALSMDPDAQGGVGIEDFIAAVTAAQDDGVRSSAHVTFLTMEVGRDTSSSYLGAPVAAWGDIDWDAIMTQGTPPAAGEVALSEAYASVLGLQVGDSTHIYDHNGTQLNVTATVSGLTRSPVGAAGLWLGGLYDAWISPEDLAVYANAAAAVQDDRAASFLPMDGMITWDGGNSELSAVAGAADTNTWISASGMNASEQWVWLSTGVLVLGAVAMAFAFGRAQAQSRTQWVATARALGATRSHVVLATVAEAALLAGIGVAVGYLLGNVGATAHLMHVHAHVPAAGIASAASFSWLAAAIALTLGVVVSLVIAGVPAFWAARVSPAAALKPENDITTAEVGRSVKFWPVTILWIVAGTGAAVLAPRTQTEVAGAVCMLLFLALSPVVANEALRWALPRWGTWLSRRPEKVALVAGDAIGARPRQFSVPALLFALGTGTILAMASIGALQSATEGWALNSDYSDQVALTWPAWIVPTTAIVLGCLALLATVISVATTTVTAHEMTTREALGISSNQARGATGLAHGIALVIGVVTGAIFAAIVAAANASHVLATVTEESGMDWELACTLISSFYLIVMGIAVGLAVLSSVIVALVSRSPARSAAMSAAQGARR